MAPTMGPYKYTIARAKKKMKNHVKWVQLATIKIKMPIFGSGASDLMETTIKKDPFTRAFLYGSDLGI